MGLPIAMALLFVVRPLATWIAMRGLAWPAAETWTVGVFGIRGVGSLYYLAYAFNEVSWSAGETERIWAACAFAVLVSIVLHGTTVTPVMRVLDRN